MDSHGYCKNLVGNAESLGYNVIKHELFPFTANVNNPTAITIIKKETSVENPTEKLACPMYKTSIIKKDSVYYSPEALLAFPIINGIPCLKIDNGVIASKFEDITTD